MHGGRTATMSRPKKKRKVAAAGSPWMTNLSDIIEKETGKQLVIQESILMLPEEVEEVIGNKPESDILVHTAYDESTDENVMLLTSDAPEYKPWALVIQDSNGENKIKMLSGGSGGSGGSQFTNLSDIIEKETGKQLVIQESILMLPEEVEEVIGNKPESDILVHTAYDESTDENVMLLTSDAPEYKPWALVIQDSNGENKIKMLSGGSPKKKRKVASKGATNFSLLKQAGDVEENPGPTEYKPTVRLATRDDVPRAVRTLAAAFADYPATRHTVDPDRHIERVTELQELFLTRVGLDIGKVWVADDGAAVAVWTTPESVEAGAVFAEIGPRMAELSGSRLAAQQQMEGLLAPHRPKEPAWFLATVGVSPDHQGKGLGSAVVLPGVEAAERAGVPAFLETSAPRNLPFYERLGFTVTADVEVPEGPRTWCMTRKPGA